MERFNCANVDSLCMCIATHTSQYATVLGPVSLGAPIQLGITNPPCHHLSHSYWRAQRPWPPMCLSTQSLRLQDPCIVSTLRVGHLAAVLGALRAAYLDLLFC